MKWAQRDYPAGRLRSAPVLPPPDLVLHGMRTPPTRLIADDGTPAVYTYRIAWINPEMRAMQGKCTLIAESPPDPLGPDPTWQPEIDYCGRHDCNPSEIIQAFEFFNRGPEPLESCQVTSAQLRSIGKGVRPSLAMIHWERLQRRILFDCGTIPRSLTSCEAQHPRAHEARRGRGLDRLSGPQHWEHFSRKQRSIFHPAVFNLNHSLNHPDNPRPKKRRRSAPPPDG